MVDILHLGGVGNTHAGASKRDKNGRLLVRATTHLGSEESLASTHKRCWGSPSLSTKGKKKLEAGSRVVVARLLWFKSGLFFVEGDGKSREGECDTDGFYLAPGGVCARLGLAARPCDAATTKKIFSRCGMQIGPLPDWTAVIKDCIPESTENSEPCPHWPMAVTLQ
jgi:hypothetical protein